MDPPSKKPAFSCLPSSDSLTSPVGRFPDPSSFSSSSDVGKAAKGEDTFVVGEYHLTSCPICLERFTLDNPAILVVCGHGFHLQCLENWRQRSPMCPVCMKIVDDGGVPMMYAQETRRRRRYGGGNMSKGSCKQGQHLTLLLHNSGTVPQTSLPRHNTTPTEEHVVESQSRCCVMCALRSVLRWCFQSAG